MATTIQNQIASIYAAASHFALFGYHTSTIISKESGTAECCIYFHNIRMKARLTNAMQCFADEGDKIEFHEFEKSLSGKFYTIQLKKELAL